MTWFDVPVYQSFSIIHRNWIWLHHIYEWIEHMIIWKNMSYKSVMHTQKKGRICKLYSLWNNYECRSHLYHIGIRKFMDVNKHNLRIYSKVFQFNHNKRTKTWEQRFMDILCIRPELFRITAIRNIYSNYIYKWKMQTSNAYS